MSGRKPTSQLSFFDSMFNGNQGRCLFVHLPHQEQNASLGWVGPKDVSSFGGWQSVGADNLAKGGGAFSSRFFFPAQIKEAAAAAAQDPKMQGSICASSSSFSATHLPDRL